MKRHTEPVIVRTRLSVIVPVVIRLVMGLLLLLLIAAATCGLFTGTDVEIDIAGVYSVGRI